MRRPDPASTALLVIDLQRDVVEADVGGIAAWAGDVLERVAAIVAACRGRGLHIVWVRVERRPDLLDQVELPTDRILSGEMPSPREAFRLVAESAGAAPAGDLAAEPGDDVVVKRRVSAFHGTDLDLLLRARGIRTLLVAGAHTENGVESTVRDAWDHDYACVVLSDCCASPRPDGHQGALTVTLPRFARVLTADAALQLIGDVHD